MPDPTTSTTELNAIRDVATFLATEPNESDRMMARELYAAHDSLRSHQDALEAKLVQVKQERAALLREVGEKNDLISGLVGDVARMEAVVEASRRCSKNANAQAWRTWQVDIGILRDALARLDSEQAE